MLWPQLACKALLPFLNVPACHTCLSIFDSKNTLSMT